MIIIVFGLPGSGKSYFASRLAKELQANYVSSDVIRKKLFDHIEYSNEEKIMVYEQMIKEMKKAMRQGEDIVLDATFYKDSIRNKLIKTANDNSKKILFVEVWANPEIIFERLRVRREYSDADYTVYTRIKEIFEPMEMEHLKIQSTQENIKEMLDMAANYIENHHG